MRHLELFSGIGGFRKALEAFAVDNNITIETIGFSEIDKEAIKTYKANYNTSNEIELGDIKEFNSNLYNIKNLPVFDLLTGGFPCQSFSMMGNQLGFNDERGNLFFEILKIAHIKKPRFILLENVKNLTTHNKGKTFKTITRLLKEEGYTVYHDIFNSNDFGLAQKRNRVFIFATLLKMNKSFRFDSDSVKKAFKDNISDSILHEKTTHDILEKKTDKKYYLSEKIKPTILSDGSANFKSNSEINMLVARPLTATMAKMHRACQDNYFSDGYIHSENPLLYKEISFTKEELSKQNIRKLTPKEAFLLQGFDECFIANAIAVGVSNAQLYKQAGNAVSVNTVYAIINYLYKNNALGGK